MECNILELLSHKNGQNGNVIADEQIKKKKNGVNF